MRLLFLLCLISIASIATGANVTIKCDNMPVEAFIAEITRQAGEEIALAAPTDKTVTAKLTDVSLEQALDVAAGACEGVFARDETGYRIYPKPTSQEMLALIRQAYSPIREIEIRSETHVSFKTGKKEVRSETATWKSPGLYRVEGASSTNGKAVNTTTVCDGRVAWRWRSGECAVSKRTVSDKIPRRTFVGPADLSPLAFLSNPDPNRLPGLKCTSVEKASGRVVFVTEFGTETADPGWMPRRSGRLSQSVPDLEMAYLFSRPQLRLQPSVPDVTRIGVDAKTGLIVFEESHRGWGFTRSETSDIREVAPGVNFPFHMAMKSRRSDGELQMLGETIVVRARVNFGTDEKLFTFHPPPDVFTSDLELDRETCVEQLSERPNDPDLHCRHAELLQYSPESAAKALQEYKHAAELKPAARPKLLHRLLKAAVRAKSLEDALVFIAELREAEPEDRETAEAIAEAYASLGQNKEALDEYGRLAATCENRTEAPLLAIAELCEKEGDKARAERLYLELMSIGNEQQCASTAGKLAAMYSAERRPESLRAPLETALKRHPDSPPLLAEYGIMLLDVGQPEAAMSTFRHAAKCDTGRSISKIVGELKRRRNYAGAKEIAAIYLETSDERSKGEIARELTQLYLLEKLPVGEAVAAYKHFFPAISESAERNSVCRAFREMFQRMKVLGDAVAAAKNAWRANPSDLDLAYLLVDLAAPRWTGDKQLEVSTSAAAIEQLLGVWPNNPVLHGMLGEIYVIGKDYSKAVPAFQKGIELSPNNPYYYSQLACVYSRTEKHDLALDVARQLIKKDTENPSHYLVLGVVYVNASIYTGAIEQFKKADDLFQTNRYQGERSDAAVSAIIACYAKMGDIESVQKHMELKVERAGSEWRRLQAMRELARFHAQNGKMDQAVRQLVQIEKTCVGRDVGYAIQGCRYNLTQEQQKELADALAAALKDNPELTYCKLLLARLYTDVQNTPAANNVLVELTQRAWDDVSLLREVSAIAGSHKAFNNLAIKICTRLMFLEPSEMEHVSALAFVYSNAGFKSEAVKLAKEIVRTCRLDARGPGAPSDAKSAQLVSSAARILSRFEMWDETLEAYQLAIRLNPENWEEYQARAADVYEKRGDLDSAIAVHKRIAKESQVDYRRQNALYQLVSIHERRDEKDLAVKYLRQIMAMSKSRGEKENIQRRIDRLTGETEKPNRSPAANPAAH